MNQPRISLLLLGDLVLLGVSFFATLAIRFGSLSGSILKIHLVPFLILYTAWLIVFFAFELYDMAYHQRGISLYTKIAQALLAATLLSVTFFYTIPFFGITPRTTLAINIFVFGLLFVTWRIIFSDLVAKRFTVPATIFDPEDSLRDLAIYLQKNPQFGISPITLTQTINHPPHGLLIIDSRHTPATTTETLLAHAATSVVDATTIYERYEQKIPLELVSSSFILRTIQTEAPLLYRLIHGLLDPLIALSVALVTLPITALTALLIWLEDRGPIFYKQVRTGKYGKPFLLYKFRSMRMDAEKHGAQWSSGASDTRVTRIGKIIRKLHIDEIPQMINIIRGDLALIGPRAERPEFVAQLEQEIPHYRLRHIIKPGFTGWAQIKFLYARSVMDSYHKFEYDLYYIKNRNLVMDLAILVRTAYIIIKH